MASSHGTLVVFGAGPGVGQAIANLFAERGFAKVVLLSRDANRLAKDAEDVRSISSTVTVHDIPVDLSDAEDLQKALLKINNTINRTPLECVLFNAARTGKSKFFDFHQADLRKDIQIAVLSLYGVAEWAVPRLLDTAGNGIKTPSLLVTSGLLAKDPYPTMFSLATCKAAQLSLMRSLHKEFEPKGVHCGVIIIGGTVSSESKVTNPRNIAETAWNVFRQSREKGDAETTLLDPAYDEHVKQREQ